MVSCIGRNGFVCGYRIPDFELYFLCISKVIWILRFRRNYVCKISVNGMFVVDVPANLDGKDIIFCSHLLVNKHRSSGRIPV